MPTPPPEPPWARVLATTVRLWVLRRRRLVSAVVAVVLVTAAALGFSGAFAGTATTAAHARAAVRPSRTSTAPHRSGRSGSAAVQEAVQEEVAEWIAGQVSGDAIIACDPAMCAALQARGVAATRLMSLTGRSTTGRSAGPRGAAVVVTSTAAYDQYAPAVIASFGSGAERIEVRAAEPGGTAGYQSALRADLQARMSASAQLLRNDRIRFTARDAAQLHKGEVDARVLATLAALSSQYSFTVTAFGDAAPGAVVLYRGVTIAGAGLKSALALVKAQDQPYLPVYAAILQPAGGQPAALSVAFAAPSPLGLLTAVLTANQSSAAR